MCVKTSWPFQPHRNQPALRMYFLSLCLSASVLVFLLSVIHLEIGKSSLPQSSQFNPPPLLTPYLSIVQQSWRLVVPCSVRTYIVIIRQRGELLGGYWTVCPWPHLLRLTLAVGVGLEVLGRLTRPLVQTLMLLYQPIHRSQSAHPQPPLGCTVKQNPLNAQLTAIAMLQRSALIWRECEHVFLFLYCWKLS